MNRIRFSAIAVLAATANALLAATPAQPYPQRPLRLIVPNGAGGSTDFVARLVAGKLAEALGQQVIADNRGGSGGIIGTEIVAKAAPDGHTLLIGTIGNLAISPHLYRKLGYDALRDFAPVSQLSSAAYMLIINPGLPARSVREFVAYGKSKPGQITYASAGSGTGSHLSAVLFTSVAGLDLIHVPYKGAAPAMTDIIANQVQLMVNGVTSSLPQVNSGRLRALAVTAPRRVAAAPDLPTLAESGIHGAESTSWTGVLVPAATPPQIVERLNLALRAILDSPDVKNRFATDGAEVAGGPAADFARYIREEHAKWGKVVRATGARAD